MKLNFKKWLKWALIKFWRPSLQTPGHNTMGQLKIVRSDLAPKGWFGLDNGKSVLWTNGKEYIDVPKMKFEMGNPFDPPDDGSR